MSSEHAARIRYVVRHTPGPKWQPGVDFRAQQGIEAHVNHYRAAYQAGHLEMGGPFLGIDLGGMMIPDEGLSEQAVRDLADQIPPC